jgi:hypothetical protein
LDPQRHPQVPSPSPFDRENLSVFRRIALIVSGIGVRNGHAGRQVATGRHAETSQDVIFTIDTENNITACESTPAAPDGLIVFATEKEFTKATAEWPIPRLVETWNSFAGTPGFDELKPVKKFTDRKTAIGRIWTAIQKLVPVAEASLQAPAALAAAKTKAPKAKVAKPAQSNGEKKAPRAGTAKAKVIAMMQRKGGATLEQICKATGWQRHTTRGFISVLGSKHGMKIESTRLEDGARSYAITVGGAK